MLKGDQYSNRRDNCSSRPACCEAAESECAITIQELVKTKENFADEENSFMRISLR